MAGKGPEIIVVGAGIIGASIAWNLTRAGAKVTIVEAGEPGGVATPNSFSWINSNYSFAKTYFTLRHHSMSEWRRLAAELPRLPVSFSGSIYLPAKEFDLEEFVRRNSSWGYRIELIDGARAMEIEPNWRYETGIAAHAYDEGAAEAEDVARCLVAAAVEEGAQLRQNSPVERLTVSESGVGGVRANGETIAADEVVIAAGVATSELVSGTGYDLPLKAPPGLLVHTKPVSRALNGLVLSEGLHIRQKANGQLLAGSDFLGSELVDDPESGARELMRRMRAALNTEEALTLARATIGHRPTPEDGLPVIGRPPGVTGLYVAVMHSGVTLCPAVGALATRELMHGERDALLTPFGLERFLEAPQASARV